MERHSDLVRQRTQTTRTRARQLAHTGRSVMLGDELTAIVRTMFVLYTLLIAPGRDYNTVSAAFNRMVQSLRVNDDAAHASNR